MGHFITLTERSDFLRTQHRGSKAVSKAFVLQGYSRSSSDDGVASWRVGFTASKRVGNAVCRNRAKRRLRALVHNVMSDQARDRVDYVLIARLPLTDKSFKLDPNALAVAMEELHRKLDRRSTKDSGRNSAGVSANDSGSNTPGRDMTAASGLDIAGKSAAKGLK